MTADVVQLAANPLQMHEITFLCLYSGAQSTSALRSGGTDGRQLSVMAGKLLGPACPSRSNNYFRMFFFSTSSFSDNAKKKCEQKRSI